MHEPSPAPGGRRWPRRDRPLGRAAGATPFGADETRRFARWLGLLYLFGALVALIALAFPAAPFASVPVGFYVVGIATAVGLALLAGIADHRGRRTFELLIALGSLLAGAGVYSGGSPTSGAQFFFLWVVPLAFAFFTLRQAAIQAIWMGLIYGAVLWVQVIQHPAIGSRGLLAGMWIIVMATVGIIGALVRRLSRSLREVDMRFERSFNDSPVGAAILSNDLDLLDVNEALSATLGRDREALLGRSLLDFTLDVDRELTVTQLTEETSGTSEFEARLFRPDATVLWTRISSAFVEPEIGEPYRFAQIRDVTAHKRDQESLAHRAIHDPLTGLFNRTLFLDRLATALRHERPVGRVAAIMLDLDRFKVVNDSLGHQVGDQLLAAIAPRLAAALTPADTLARFGGDEFIVLCDELREPLDAVDRAERLAEALVEPIELETGSYVVGASIGIAVATESNTDAQSLVRDADSAMYRAKATGRNRIEIFDQSMREEALHRLALERDLREAVPRGELHIEYQPVVDVDTGLPVFLEALVRWHHPTRGRLEPASFVPLAEETGQIFEIGHWVLERALGQLELWQQRFPSDPPLCLSVNVSGRQFSDERFCDDVAELVRASGIAPHSLGIEITESVLFAPDPPGGTLDTLRALGVRILLDDFGTGYSSLAYLERFPIDVLKVDQSFVERLRAGEKGVVFLEAILALARALGIHVVAEGVEDQPTIATLRRLGCTWIQGFAVTRALRAEEVGRFLEEHRAVARALDPGTD